MQMFKLGNIKFLLGSLRLILSAKVNLNLRFICFTISSVHKDCFHF